MKSKLNFRRKALEPLIAAILLIVVAVILITIVLSWGKMFTTDALNKTTVAELTQSDAEAFIYPKALQDGVLQFSYSPQSNFGEIVISKYKVISDSGETPDTNLSAPYTLKQGTNVISLTSFSSFGLTTNTKVTIILQTTSNQYISIKNITNNYTAPIVNLPYVMFGNRKLYIQPDQNSDYFTWANAISYCDDLDVNGYDDWYLPSALQLRAIWDTYTYQAGDSCLQGVVPNDYITLICINNTIRATYDGFVNFIGDYYWSSTEFGSSSAYDIYMGSGYIGNVNKASDEQVRCVRDQ